ncbi:MAG: tyrosine-protein phosphatase [Acidobacteriaceae bacterium]
MKLSYRSPATIVICALCIVCSGSGTVAKAFSQAEKAEVPSEGSHSPAIAIDDIPRFAEVTSHLYRGGQPNEKGFAGLAKMGIDIVVDARGSRRKEREVVNKLGMKYVPIPWHCPFPKDKTFARFLALLRDNPDKKVFVHCRLGNDRTGMMIASYRMAEQGWSAKKAQKEMQAYGFSASHHLICPGLAGYEEDFPEKFAKSRDFENIRGQKQPAVTHP